MHGALIEAVLCDPPNGRPRSSSDPTAISDVHRLETTLKVPEKWVVQGTFDYVQFHFVGRLKTRVLFTACRENIIALTGRRSKNDFRSMGTSVDHEPPWRTAAFTFAIPDFADLPATQSVLANSYLARKGGFGGQQIQAHAEVAYHVEARVMRGVALLGCVSVAVRIPQHSPVCIATPSPHDAPASAPALPRLVRRALSASPPEDLHVRVFDTLHAPTLPIRSRSLHIPISLLLRDTPARARLRAQNGTLHCAVDARWSTTQSIATEPLDATKRLVPPVDESTRGPRHRAELAFPPFCEARRHSAVNAAGTDADGKLAYATTAELRVPVPAGIVAGPSIARGLFERSYALRLDVTVAIAPDMPLQTAHVRVQLRVMAREPAAADVFGDAGEGRLSGDAAECIPPPAYALAMQDPIVTIAA